MFVQLFGTPDLSRQRQTGFKNLTGNWLHMALRDSLGDLKLFPSLKRTNTEELSLAACGVKSAWGPEEPTCESVPLPGSFSDSSSRFPLHTARPGKRCTLATAAAPPDRSAFPKLA